MPRKIIENYLADTYYNDFTLKGKDFYVEHKNYIWKYTFVDQSGLEFDIYYRHLSESAEGFFYLLFDNKMGNWWILDYYWQAKLRKEFEEELRTEKYEKEFDGGTPSYIFEIKTETDIDEISKTISITLSNIPKYVKTFTDKTIGMYVVIYQGKSIYTLGIDNKISKVMDMDQRLLEQYIYNEIYDLYIQANN
ncbi:MAG: hypothetical protein J6J79_09285 [Lachnospiraceae bacterium]|nr:hypothetical protein [Lachnospiraceae bacterium]